jgi:murein DD-endopeptidase MepM/ murein hydrolase activator NlpD
MLGASPCHARLAACLGAAVFLVLLAGCTDYQPVERDGPPVLASRAPVMRTAPASAAQRHVVRAGDTLSALAVRYETSMAQLARINGLRKPYKLLAGQVLALPHPSSSETSVVAEAVPRPAPAESRRRSGTPRPADEPTISHSMVQQVALGPTSQDARPGSLEGDSTPPPLSGDGFLWPVRGKVIDGFGAKPSGARNDGINIAADPGTPVHAAENGVVVYADGSLPGFGRMLLIRHADGFTTAYAHNAKLFVGVGDHVGRGQLIAEVGSTGGVSSPQLHFELRMGAKAIDPVSHLTVGQTQVASSGGGSG